MNLEVQAARPDADQAVWLTLTPAQFRAFLSMRGNRAAPRLCYQEPHLELMSPSKNHEAIKELLGRLLEVWADANDVELHSMGSLTLVSRRHDVGVEPDKSYLVGTASGDLPHMAIEVAWSRDATWRLEVYAALGVREVWVWENEGLRVHSLRRGRYVVAQRSALLRDLDLAHFCRYLARWPRPAGLLKEYRASLRH
jgi:Uma2 family endonuclease